MSAKHEPSIIELFNRDPDNYDRARGGYKSEFVAQTLQHMLQEMPNRSPIDPIRVVDIGAGTGRLGEEFLKLGCNVTFVEPSDKSYEHLKTRFGKNPAATIVHAKADSTGLPKGSADIITFGDSAHWIKPTELPELRRILKPEGKLAVFTRLWSQVSPLTKKANELLMTECGEDYQRSPAKLIRNLSNLNLRHGTHLVDESSNFIHGYGDNRTYDKEALMAYFKSASFSTRAIERDEVSFRKNVLDPLWEFAEEKHMLGAKGELRLPYETRVMYGAPRARIKSGSKDIEIG